MPVSNSTLKVFHQPSNNIQEERPHYSKCLGCTACAGNGRKVWSETKLFRVHLRCLVAILHLYCRYPFRILPWLTLRLIVHLLAYPSLILTKGGVQSMKRIPARQTDALSRSNSVVWNLNSSAQGAQGWVSSDDSISQSLHHDLGHGCFPFPKRGGFFRLGVWHGWLQGLIRTLPSFRAQGVPRSQGMESP